jgi:hypothetical protein
VYSQAPTKLTDDTDPRDKSESKEDTPMTETLNGGTSNDASNEFADESERG